MVDYIVGIDFGHGETSVAKVKVSSISEESLTITTDDLKIAGNDDVIPSLIAYNEDGVTSIDVEAEEFQNLKVYAYFKAPMIGSDKYECISPEKKEHFKDFAILVKKSVLDNPKNSDLIGKSIEWYVACPSGWNKEQMDSYLDFFNNDCNLGISGVIKESRCAYVRARRMVASQNNTGINIGDERVAVFDMGSSTLDITLHNTEKAIPDGFPCGASKVECLIYDHFYLTDPEFHNAIDRFVDLGANLIEQNSKKYIPQVLYLIRKDKEDFFDKIAKNPQIDAIFKCSIDLTYLSQGQIDFDKNLKLSRKGLCAVLEEGNYFSEIKEALYDFKNSYGDIDAAVLTGGGSQMFFFIDFVKEVFGINKVVVDPKPSYSISQGTAMIGYIEARMKEMDGGIRNPLEWTPIKTLLSSIEATMLETINQVTRDIYKSELHDAINNWKLCKVEYEGRVSCMSLAHAFDKVLENWSKNFDTISNRINKGIEIKLSEKISQVLKEKLRLYYGREIEVEKPKFHFNFPISLTAESIDNLAKCFWVTLVNTINTNHFWGWSDASAKKDRRYDSDDLKLISSSIISMVDDWFKDVNYSDSLSEESAVCKETTQNLILKIHGNMTQEF